MKRLDEQMLSYSTYHRHPSNKRAHFFGVPLVILSILIPLETFQFTYWPSFTFAQVFVLGAVAYYFCLDKVLALFVLPFALLFLWISHSIVGTSFLGATVGFVATFVSGWMIQLWGHRIEGNRPALTQSILQIFNAPLFLCLELQFALGYRGDTKKWLEQNLQEGVE